MTRSHTTFSAEETKKLASDFAKSLVAKGVGERSLVLLLQGDLGSGKTTFTKAFLAELGVDQEVTSPTFVLINRYSLEGAGGYKQAYHIDAYRLNEDPKAQGARAVKTTDNLLEEPLSSSEHIVLVEWPRNLFSGKQVTFPHWFLEFSHGDSGEERRITITAKT